jgi:putative nucleotidyltransferase with HDIG domain
VLVSTGILTYVALIQPWSLRQTSLALAVGDVAPQNMRAPSDIQYVSDVLTEGARADAERTVDPVYEPPDPTIARSQIESLDAMLRAISAVRAEEKPLEEKQFDVAGLRPGGFEPDALDLLLWLSDERWEMVQAASLELLGAVMQEPVRSEDLETIRQGLLARVSFTLSRSEAGLVADLVSPLLAANSFYSPELTEAARQAARDAVPPVTRSYIQGQTVVAEGQIITAADLEALTVLALVRPESPLYDHLGAAALAGLSIVLAGLYFIRRQPQAASNLRSLLLLAILFIVFLIGARVSIPNRTVVPYLFPIPAFGLLVSALFSIERGMLFALLMSLLGSYGLPDALGLAPYYVLSSLCGILALGRARRLVHYLYAGAAIAGAGTAVIAAYRLPFTDTDWVGLATLLGAAVFMGLASASLALPLQYLLAQFLGLTTPLQLLEISRPDSRLLSFFLQRAPGTYQHSLQVANLAEQAAERIGADALLTRVGALLHDVGKALDPLYFIENQPPAKIDSHDDLPPEVSAAAIIDHIPKGVELARRHRLPRRLQDFILEHHGTLLARYQYNRAVELAGGDASKVDESKFRYPGPKPRSKETALLMFADGVEARARAERPSNADEVRLLVQSVIESRRKDGQLDDAPLSQRDLTAITESFVSTLGVTYHPRLDYPREPAAEPASGSDSPEVPAEPPGQAPDSPPAAKGPGKRG